MEWTGELEVNSPPPTPPPTPPLPRQFEPWVQQYLPFDRRRWLAHKLALISFIHTNTNCPCCSKWITLCCWRVSKPRPWDHQVVSKYNTIQYKTFVDGLNFVMETIHKPGKKLWDQAAGYAWPNKNVFNCLSNFEIVSELLIWSGNLFQIWGAATENALEAKTVVARYKQV